MKTLYSHIAAANDHFLEDVIHGLSQQEKTLPCKYFYNEDGAFYFESICSSQDYYVTRTELAIMNQYKIEMAQKIGPYCLLLEYGSGSSTKTRLLLDHLKDPCAYVPIDICPEYLDESVSAFGSSYPHLEILPVHADFTQPFTIPKPSHSFARKLIYFPGSTIGNFSPPQASGLLKQMRSICHRPDMVLIGVDLKKNKHILNKAYNDREGFTAAFNLNLLQRINHELFADFNLENFRHRAFYNDKEGRIEMHLGSVCPQVVSIDRHSFFFRHGETIQTEFSYKYDMAGLERLAETADFKIHQIWTDKNKFFAIVLLTTV